jgi:hypothetical protein
MPRSTIETRAYRSIPQNNQAAIEQPMMIHKRDEIIDDITLVKHRLDEIGAELQNTQAYEPPKVQAKPPPPPSTVVPVAPSNVGKYDFATVHKQPIKHVEQQSIKIEPSPIKIEPMLPDRQVIPNEKVAIHQKHSVHFAEHPAEKEGNININE